MTLVGFGVNPPMLTGPSAWYRVFGPAAMLAKRGLADGLVADRCGVPDVLGPLALQPIGIDPPTLVVPDVVIFHYTSVPAPAMERARAAGQRVFLDLDDDIWAVPDYNVFAAKIRHDAEQLPELMKAATAVLCSTPTLARVCHQETNARTLVAPNIYDPDRYEQRRPWEAEHPVIGWHGLCRTSGDDIRLIGELMRPVLERHPELMFRHVGAEQPDDFALMAGLPVDRVQSRPGVPMPNLPAALDFDIGLVVRANNGFNRSRTNTKGFELAASATPVVAVTDIAEYADTPFLVEPEGFADRIEQLLDPIERMQASTQAAAWAAATAAEHAESWPYRQIAGTLHSGGLILPSSPASRIG